MTFVLFVLVKQTNRTKRFTPSFGLYTVVYQSNSAPHNNSNRRKEMVWALLFQYKSS